MVSFDHIEYDLIRFGRFLDGIQTHVQTYSHHAVQSACLKVALSQKIWSKTKSAENATKNCQKLPR